MLPHVYQVTKYNPADRDQHGHCAGAEPATSDHGPIEAACLEAVAAFAEDTGVDQLAAREPQLGGFAHFGLGPPVDGYGLADLFPAGLDGFHDGALVPIALGLELVRAMLRDSGAWCRLEAEGEFTVHVGWDWAFLKTLRRGQVVTGTVTSIAGFGVTFVDIGGFTAMINLPELSWRPFDHPSDIVSVGQEITAEVLDIDMVWERVPLSLRAVQEDPWPQVAQWLGQVVTGPVTKVLPFRVFVRIEDREDGFQGLVHTGELDQAPEDVIEVGDVVTVKIIDADVPRRRIALSQRQADQ
ncbi:S1 RNA-binding domain-containing protein [Streptomyces sp. NPDC049040]|uniref:S1 RNA-binding domain-containing protein n=1 Tax=Streptomyces sp. NPDC049040 TaxID=3365593 RepID=UPI003716B190